MSSNTEINVTPPPLVETTVSGSRVASLARLFGPQGCELLQSTFQDLCSESSSIIAGLTSHVQHDQALLQAERAKLSPLFGWRQDEQDRRLFRLGLQGERIPQEAARAGVESAEVQVRVESGLLRTHVEYTARGTAALTDTQRHTVTQSLQRTVNRLVNHVLVATVQQQVAQTLRARVAERQRASVHSRLDNAYTMRTYAQVTVSTFG